MKSVEQPDVQSETEQTHWLLIGSPAAGTSPQKFPIQSSRFQVGRRPELHLCIPRVSVSKLHAEFLNVNHLLFIRDLQSTNGTFVNGQRISSDTPVAAGDIVQFADVEFRVDSCSAIVEHEHTQASSPQDWQWAVSSVSSLINGRQLIPFFQPIVSITDRSVKGYEVLARSAIPRLKSPLEMFHAAGLLGLQSRLSELSREMGVLVTDQLVPFPRLFLNTHPSEHEGSGLVQSLESLLLLRPQVELVLELHEGAITDLRQMRSLRDELRRMGIRLAFDDFGAGQSRLVELAEIAPDFLKFDMGLIRDIHKSTPRQQLVGSILRIAKDMGIVSLAEGIECEEEGQVCREMGFELAQGYFYGRPARLEDIVASRSAASSLG